jgi:hypothetical protein
MTGRYPKYLQIYDRLPTGQLMNFRDVVNAAGRDLLPRGGPDAASWMSFLNGYGLVQRYEAAPKVGGGRSKQRITWLKPELRAKS